jgi:hypothetical protein
MLRAFLVALASTASTLVQPAFSPARANETYDRVSFYFAAHEDDWQLFMNPSAFMDVVGAKSKAVFVHVTAGDGGLGVGNGGRKFPYYLARENGAVAAVRFMADTDLPVSQTDAAVTLNGHQVYRMGYRNTVSYFLRLPDGNADGAGFAATGNQSLARLAGAQISSLNAVDRSKSYLDWKDLVMTVRAILDYERGAASSVGINVAETDSHLNPADHSDHLMSAKVALDAARPHRCIARTYFIDYASASLPENLVPKQRDLESSAFAVTAYAIRALDHYNAWHHYNDNYIGKNYFRSEDGSGPCTASPAIVTSPQTVAVTSAASLRPKSD